VTRVPRLTHWSLSSFAFGGQIYVGADKRSYIPVEYRPPTTKPHGDRYISSFSKRSRVATYAGKNPAAGLPTSKL